MAEQRSDLARAFSEDGALKTHVGGQALIEGVMMRGKHNWSVAVREPSGGIYVEEHDLPGPKGGASWLRWPLVRGCRAMVESLVLGYKALEIAALHAFGRKTPTIPQVKLLRMANRCRLLQRLANPRPVPWRLANRRRLPSRPSTGAPATGVPPRTQGMRPLVASAPPRAQRAGAPAAGTRARPLRSPFRRPRPSPGRTTSGAPTQ